MNETAISDARQNLAEVVNAVHYTRQPVSLTRRGRALAAVVTQELADAAEAVGGLDKATEILKHAGGG